MATERTERSKYTADFERKAKWAEVWAVIGVILALGLVILLSRHKFASSFTAPGEMVSENMVRVAVPKKEMGRIKIGDEVETYLQHPDVRDSFESPFHGRVVELGKEALTSEDEAVCEVLIELSSTPTIDLHKSATALTVQIVTDSNTLIMMLFEKKM